MTTVAIYTRVAATDTATPSHERQVAVCQRWVAEHGHTIGDVYSDTGMGREAFRRMLDNVDQYDVVVAASLDRLTRIPRDLETLLDTPAKIATVLDGIDTGHPSGALTLRVLANHAAHESERHSERTKRGIAAARARKAADQ